MTELLYCSPETNIVDKLYFNFKKDIILNHSGYEISFKILLVSDL